MPPNPPTTLDPELLLAALTEGYFPMGRGQDAAEIDWYRPDPRAVMPLEEDRFKVRRSLAKALRRADFEIRFDVDFAAVIDACAEPRPQETGTWINATIREAYIALAEMGFGHSVEAFDAAGRRVGGLYGVALGGAFLGESMFSRCPYASQACLVALVERLRRQGFELLDVQFVNPHLEQFGVLEIPAEQYHDRLQLALTHPPRWGSENNEQN